MRQLELLAESFNLFNHQNVTELETTGYSIESGGTSGTFPTLCYLTINTTTATRVAELDDNSLGHRNSASRLRPAAQHQRHQLLPRTPNPTRPAHAVLDEANTRCPTLASFVLFAARVGTVNAFQQSLSHSVHRIVPRMTLTLSLVYNRSGQSF